MKGSLHFLFHNLIEWSRSGWSRTASMKGHITVWGKMCRLQRGTPLQLKDPFAVLMFATRLRQFFILGYFLKFSVCLFVTQNRDFLLEKRYTTHQQNNKTIFCF